MTVFHVSTSKKLETKEAVLFQNFKMNVIFNLKSIIMPFCKA